MKFWKYNLVIALILSSLVFSCSKSATTTTSAAQGAAPAAGGARGGAGVTVPVEASVTRLDDLIVERSTAGVVTALNQSNVAAQVSGVVSRVSRKVGDWVSQGDLVLSLNTDQFEIAASNARASLATANANLANFKNNQAQVSGKLTLQVDSAQAAVDAAQRFYNAQQALFDMGGISATQLDNAKSQLTTAQASLESARVAQTQNTTGTGAGSGQSLEVLQIAVSTARNNYAQANLNLRNAMIRAPFDGQIAAINVNKGAFVGNNTTVFVIVSKERTVNFNITPQDAALFSRGMTVDFELGDKHSKLTLTQEPSAPIGGLVPIIIQDKAVQQFAYGAVGRVSYKVKIAHGVLVPVSALVIDNSKYSIFTIVDGKVQSRDVTILVEAAAIAAVTGLEPGLTIVNNPPPGLVNGAKVTVSKMLDPLTGQEINAGDANATDKTGKKPTDQGAANKDSASNPAASKTTSDTANNDAGKNTNSTRTRKQQSTTEKKTGAN